MKTETPKAKCQRGTKLLKEGKVEEAKAQFTEALELADKPQWKATALYNIAICQYRKGDRKGAIEFLDRAMSEHKSARDPIDVAEDFRDLQDELELLAVLRKYPLSNIWLAIYTYVRIPIALLVLIRAVISGGNGLLKSLEPGLSIVSLVFYGALFIGLIIRRRWAWYMIWVALLLDAMILAGCIMYPIVLSGKRPTPADIIMPLIISLVFWVWPNYVYFRKRRHLFV